MERSYSNFTESLRTEKTRAAYDSALKEFRSWIRAGTYDELAKVEPKALQDKLVDYIRYLKGRKLAPLSVRLKIAGIKHFFDMNDLIINWVKVRKFIGSSRIKTKDRIYTKEEIRKILDKCDERKRVILLLLVSTGVRIGALPSLRIKDIAKIEEHGVYRVVVYADEPEEYITFTSIECAKAIDSYLAYRKSKGETLKPNAPLIREQFSLSNPSEPRALSLGGLQTLLLRAIEDSGIRERGNDYTKRHEVMMFHGFRKYCNTMMSQAGLKPAIKEMLLGHRVGLEKNYLRPSDEELLSEYLKAVQLLTISDAEEWKAKAADLQLTVDEKLKETARTLDELRAEIAELRATRDYKAKVKARMTELASAPRAVNRKKPGLKRS